MINLIKTISTELNQAGQRIIKALKHGKGDIRTAYQSTPFGIDSSPLRDMQAVYMNTEELGRSVVVGYLDKSMLADDGESRLYSLDSNGNLKAYIWLKKDGTILMNGDQKHMVRFEELKQGFDQLKSDLNSLVSKFNAHVHSGVSTGGGVSGGPTTTGDSSGASIDASKIDEIKTL